MNLDLTWSDVFNAIGEDGTWDDFFTILKDDVRWIELLSKSPEELKSLANDNLDNFKTLPRNTVYSEHDILLIRKILEENPEILENINVDIPKKKVWSQPFTEKLFDSILKIVFDVIVLSKIISLLDYFISRATN